MFVPSVDVLLMWKRYLADHGVATFGPVEPPSTGSLVRDIMRGLEHGVDTFKFFPAAAAGGTALR